MHLRRAPFTIALSWAVHYAFKVYLYPKNLIWQWKEHPLDTRNMLLVFYETIYYSNNSISYFTSGSWHMDGQRGHKLFLDLFMKKSFKFTSAFS